jgi:hypothetical protein
VKIGRARTGLRREEIEDADTLVGRFTTAARGGLGFGFRRVIVEFVRHEQIIASPSGDCAKKLAGKEGHKGEGCDGTNGDGEAKPARKALVALAEDVNVSGKAVRLGISLGGTQAMKDFRLSGSSSRKINRLI